VQGTHFGIFQNEKETIDTLQKNGSGINFDNRYNEEIKAHRIKINNKENQDEAGAY